MKNGLLNKLSLKLNRIKLNVRKNSPVILMTVGIAGTVASAIMACKATTKLSEVLENANERLEEIHNASEDNEFKKKHDYSDDDARKDLTIVYTQTAIQLCKLYAPAVILGTASIVSILASNNIMRKRAAALSAAYAAVDSGFKRYRKNVREKYGEEVDKELLHNVKTKIFEETQKDESGKDIKIQKEVKVSESDYSPFARFFDEGSSYWKKSPEANLAFLRIQQQYANDLLRSRGYLFLNEVYKMLDIPITSAGQIVGWRYDENNIDGDNYVDFGIYDVNREKVRDFVNGYENVILLDFNVDGVIYDLIGKNI